MVKSTLQYRGIHVMFISDRKCKLCSDYNKKKTRTRLPQHQHHDTTTATPNNTAPTITTTPLTTVPTRKTTTTKKTTNTTKTTVQSYSITCRDTGKTMQYQASTYSMLSCTLSLVNAILFLT